MRRGSGDNKTRSPGLFRSIRLSYISATQTSITTPARHETPVAHAFSHALPVAIESALFGLRILARWGGSRLRRDLRKALAPDGQDVDLSMFDLRSQPNVLPPLERRILVCPFGILLLCGSGSLLPLRLRLRLRRNRVPDLQWRILFLPSVYPQRRRMQQLCRELVLGQHQAVSFTSRMNGAASTSLLRASKREKERAK